MRTVLPLAGNADIGQTRGALKALLNATPATETVLRASDPLDVLASTLQFGAKLC
jgi:Cd2+/Zn2+-exporting ATPase